MGAGPVRAVNDADARAARAFEGQGQIMGDSAVLTRELTFAAVLAAPRPAGLPLTWRAVQADDADLADATPSLPAPGTALANRPGLTVRPSFEYAALLASTELFAGL